uniref:Uncharacterized protein n=1 Tax=Cacopsylla melanoneura TaxID=428564 RepID=A0A8D8LIL1_9HEMI
MTKKIQPFHFCVECQSLPPRSLCWRHTKYYTTRTVSFRDYYPNHHPFKNKRQKKNLFFISSFFVLIFVTTMLLNNSFGIILCVVIVILILGFNLLFYDKILIS